MYSLELAIVVCSVALLVALVLWYQFKPSIAVDEATDDLETIYPPESFEDWLDRQPDESDDSTFEEDIDYNPDNIEAFLYDQERGDM